MEGTVYASVLTHLATYFDACDRRDIDRVMQLLDGATVHIGDTLTDDPSVIRSAYEERQPAPLADGRRQTKHHVTNVLVESAADDALEVRAYYLRLEPGDERPVIGVSGRIEQRLRRSGSTWRVERHEVIRDF